MDTPATARARCLPVGLVHIRLRLWARVPNVAARPCMPILRGFPNASRVMPARTHREDQKRHEPCAPYVVPVQSALATVKAMRALRATLHRRAPNCAKSAARITCTVP